MEPLADPIAEGARIAETAAERGIALRLLGGVAIALSCPSSRQSPLRRRYGDIDFATSSVAKGEASRLLEGLGYIPDREFNTLYGHRRLYFADPLHQRQVDVFVDEANLCHRIDFRPRLELVPTTLAPADLALMKLQVVETDEKDYLDLCALFADYELSEDENGVNCKYIAELSASDWGLWRTIGIVSERTESFASHLPNFEAAGLVIARLRDLRVKLDTVPKSRRWKLRSRVGERKRWYELPEEVH
ncbi:MAG TPA: hypothetical protein VFY75_09345 [Solirubrobacterales bacterium]|nr:hypothetical protein [Solirubrobacterales bacterium]